jgi:hypothetical protein
VLRSRHLYTNNVQESTEVFRTETPKLSHVLSLLPAVGPAVMSIISSVLFHLVWGWVPLRAQHHGSGRTSVVYIDTSSVVYVVRSNYGTV